MVYKSSKISYQRHFILSSLSNCLILVILLIGFCPTVFSSPTPSLSSNRFLYGSLADDSSSSPVQDSLIQSIPYWYIQPRTHANDFLLSTMGENNMNLAKSNHDDWDDDEPSTMYLNKRSVIFNHHGGFTTLKKRKQLNKAPMEVMNEIVNSIYLKR